MKKTTLSILLLAFTVLSIACQAINTFTNPQLDLNIPTAIPTLTDLPDTATPTEPVPGAEAWIAFENQNNIWLIHPDGSGLTQVTDNPKSGSAQSILMESLAWSPNGATLAYVQSDGNVDSLLLFDIQTSKTTLLLENIGGGFDWLPNGQQIIYETPSSGGDSPSDFHNDGVWVVNVADKKTRQLVKPTSDLPTISDPRVSPIENYILFTIPCFEMNCVGYGVMDYVSGNSITLPAFGGTCEWSPNSLDIACTRNAVEASTGKNQQEIAIFDKLGSLKHSFPLPEGIQYVTLTWSPDARNLALGYYSDGGGQTDILSLETGESHLLTTGLPSTWAPNGIWVLTEESNGLGETPSKIFAVNQITGQSFPITDGTFPIWQPTSPGSGCRPPIGNRRGSNAHSPAHGDRYAYARRSLHRTDHQSQGHKQRRLFTNLQQWKNL
ncbi:MAG: hypothetical protein QM730_12160 [Anaerolineales bacterium]